MATCIFKRSQFRQVISIYFVKTQLEVSILQEKEITYHGTISVLRWSFRLQYILNNSLMNKQELRLLLLKTCRSMWSEIVPKTRNFKEISL